MTKGISRRSFLKLSAGAGAAVLAPTIVPSSVFGAEAPSNRVTVGAIGTGSRGTGILMEAFSNPATQVLGVCDVFKSRREARADTLNQKYGSKVCTPYLDLREMLARTDIDAVTIGTPDHWHVLAALLAVRAGKDVYVEKPLGLSVEQDIAIRESVHRYGRIFQYGTQQRSMAHVRHGCELVRNGRIGKLLAVEVTAPAGQVGGGSREPIAPPDELAYDLWLGPAPWSPYTKDRCTSGGSWFVSDNAHGFIGGWGAHPLDVMVWGLGDEPGAVPVEYEGKGVFGDGLFDTAGTWDVRGKFENGMDFKFVSGSDLTTFIGEKGKVHIKRSGLRTEPESLIKETIGPGEIHCYDNDRRVGHMGNFLECVRTRRQAIAHVDAAVMSDTVTQLSVIAILTGRKIKWDNRKEVIVGDAGASQLLRRAMRSPWHL